MSENWQRVQSLFLEAVDLSPEERVRFLDNACAGDAELRREVESLLIHDGASERRIAEALAAGAQSLCDGVTVKPGARVGDYEVHKLIGSGGMGEVYLARDLRLARNVAIKVLPSLLTNDPDRLRRFEQEARAAAALNHPNILAVHQMGTYQNAPYLVSELLEGATLREQIRRGPLPWRMAIEYGVQIARGLAAAHAKGITHRDLKPENLFVTKDGHVKILDFGLAKLTHAPRSSDPSDCATEAGLVMGTVGYMSPEQVRGEPADYRTDMFALGAILYEMLSGQRAFQKPTSADTMSAILNQDPPGISELVPATPPALQRVVHRCLEKNRDQRFQSASDLAFALEALSDSAISPATGTKSLPVAATLGGWGSRRWVLAGVAAAAILLLAYSLRPAMPWPHVVRVEQLTKIGQAWHLEPMFTDGPRVYYTSSDEILNLTFRQVLLNGNEDTLVAGNVPGYRIRGLSPNDTEFLATFLGALWTVPVGGGAPRRLGNLSAGDAAWSHDGRMLAYCQNGELFLASPDGTGSRLLAEVAGGIFHIRWSPDDRRLRFTVLGATGQQALWEIGVDGHQLRELRFNWPGNPMECCGEWTPDGLYFVFRSRRQGNSNLWALEDKADWWHRANRDPVQLTSGPINYSYPLPSRDGKRIFAIGSLPAGELVRYDAEHKDFVPFLRGLSAVELQFSRDRQWVTYVAVPEATLWRARSDGSEQLQLTFSPFQIFTPRWSPDGKRIAFSAKKPGEVLRTYTISVEGGNPDPLPSEPQSQAYGDWMPDGDSIIYGRDPVVETPSDNALYRANLRTGRSEKVAGTDGLYEPLWSPDGHHLAAREAASQEVLLVDLSAGNRAQLFTPYEWSAPVWSVDSQYLYFTSQDGLAIFRFRVADGRKEKVIDTNFRLSSRYIGFTPDGSLLLLREHGRSDVYSLSLSVP